MKFLQNLGGTLFPIVVIGILIGLLRLFSAGVGVVFEEKPEPSHPLPTSIQNSEPTPFGIPMGALKAYSEKNYDSALKELLPLAGGGDVNARYFVGLIFEDLELYSQAFKWYQLAAKQGHPAAQSLLGYLYIAGEGVDQNERMAYQWYQTACTNGVKSACSMVNVIKFGDR